MSTTPDMKRKPEENTKAYKYRICRDKDILGISTWQDVADILNAEFDDNKSESTYRKWFRGFDDGLEFGKDMNGDEYLQELKEQQREIKKERIKFQTEKLEYNKMLREDSRNDLLEEKIIEAINSRPTIHVPNIVIKNNNVKRDYIFPIADTHYDAEFVLRGWMDEILNEYSPEIAQKRLWSLLEQYVEQNDVDKINHVHLFNLGDSLDGILRMSQLQWIRMGNVDSAIEFAEFMSTWLNELSKYSTVDYYAVSGNHTELRLLNGKRGDFAHENMEKIVSHIIECNLKQNNNVTVHKCKNHMYVDILGTKVLGVHGHEERNLANSIAQYSQIYGHHVDLQISGHLHHSDEKTVSTNGLRDVEYVQCPSVIGIDDFSLKIKKVSNAGANLFVMNEEIGRKTIHKFRVK